ncbi:hypothetical protein ACFWIX_06960 [Pseudarthrobacter sp. NPDC058362]|uniref:hypothetical protein n=1 Tax=Pseudarthrobacter sp. NPDC058362 TaxID=3346458 RepID=UPI00365D954D
MVAVETSAAWAGRRGFAAAMTTAALAVSLAACSQPAGQGGPGSAPTASTDAAGGGTGTGNPACDLITPEIAGKVVPDLSPVGQGGGARPPGSEAYLCSYSSKSDSGSVALSVALTSPASAADVAAAKSAPDCSPVAGIGDFACLQWTGHFQGEAGGASANVVLHAVRGTEVLEMPYVVPPPMAGSVPDGDAMARAVSQAAIDAGWGNGTPLNVPAAPAVGPPDSTNNPVCALLTAVEVRQAFGASKEPQVLPGEVSCRYTFGNLGTPGPDSLIFTVEVLEATGPGPDAPAMEGESIAGLGDKAVFLARTEPTGSKSLRPAANVPTTVMYIQVTKGQTLATFVAEILISPAGPSAEQTKQQFIALVRSARL